MPEAIILGIPFVAAVIYLLVEAFDGRRWWYERRHPSEEPLHVVYEDEIGAPGSDLVGSSRPERRPQHETWSEQAIADSAEMWDELMRKEDR